MKIRNFLESDREAVIDLWETCELTRPWNDPSTDIDRKMQFQADLFFVGTINITKSDSNKNKLIASAMAGYDGHRGSVFYLAIHPDFQGNKNGQKFMEHIENVLFELGCPKLNILVRTTNVKVLGFYDQQSYSKDEVVSLGKRLIPDS